MATLKTNTLTGTSTAGSIAVTGEGNSTTTNLQQGLCKFWMKVSSSHGSLDDSFNCSSATDGGTGILQGAFSNNMANTNYMQNSELLASNYAGAVNFARWSPHSDTTNRATSGCQAVAGYESDATSAFADFNDSGLVNVHGDLA
jgi:hypothetical protein